MGSSVMGSTFSENSGETKIESILEATIQFTQALSNLVLKVQGSQKQLMSHYAMALKPLHSSNFWQSSNLKWEKYEVPKKELTFLN
jgi:hypothetical protein